MMRGFAMMMAGWLVAACGASNNGSGADNGTENGHGHGVVDSLTGSAAAITVRSGPEILPIFSFEDNLYLLGKEGLKYEICIRNKIDAAIEAVLSVDGRDVISGRVADFRKDRGYVILPKEEVCVEGFRQSMDHVAAFQFTARSESYAAQMGDEANIGVIGVAIFDETPKKSPPVIAVDGAASVEADGAASAEGTAKTAPPVSAGSAVVGEPSDDAAAEASDRGIGTGYGDGTDSQAEMVAFSRRSPETPLEVISLFYDDRQGLEAAGIEIPETISLPESHPAPTPDPFPGVTDGDVEFAPPPPGQ